VQGPKGEKKEKEKEGKGGEEEGKLSRT